MRGAELLAAVLGAPDDDAPRLVYADWLLEQGDARGELIQLQCRSPGTVAAIRREAALLAEHRRTWIDAVIPAALPRTGWTFERGFLAESAHVFDASQLAHFADIWRTTPLVKLRVRCGSADDVAVLANAPHLEDLRELDLQITGSEAAEPVLALMDSTRWNLARLRLTWWPTDLPLARRILAAPIARKLVGLGVEVRDVHDLGEVAAMVVASSLRLASLSLRGHELGGDAIARLVAARPELRRLALWCGDSGRAAVALARGNRLGALEELELAPAWGPSAEPAWRVADVVEVLGAAPRLTSLTILHERVDLRPLVPHLHGLHAFAARLCQLRDPAAIAVAELANLRALDLSHNVITKAGAAALAAAPFPALRRLDLSHNNRVGVAPLAKAAFTDGLAYLDLRSNWVALDGPITRRLRARLGAALVLDDDA